MPRIRRCASRRSSWPPLTELEKSAWYLHHTPEGRYYFDRQENLTKLLQSLAHDAPENQVDDLMRHRLTAMFKPTRKTAYDDVLPLPRIEDVADRVRRGRVLLIVSPDAKIPPEEVQEILRGPQARRTTSVSSPATRPPWGASKTLPASSTPRKSRQSYPQRPPAARRAGTKAANLRTGFERHHPQPL